MASWREFVVCRQDINRFNLSVAHSEVAHSDREGDLRCAIEPFEASLNAILEHVASKIGLPNCLGYAMNIDSGE